MAFRGQPRRDEVVGQRVNRDVSARPVVLFCCPALRNLRRQRFIQPLDVNESNFHQLVPRASRTRLR